MNSSHRGRHRADDSPGALDVAMSTVPAPLPPAPVASGEIPLAAMAREVVFHRRVVLNDALRRRIRHLGSKAQEASAAARLASDEVARLRTLEFPRARRREELQAELDRLGSFAGWSASGPPRAVRELQAEIASVDEDLRIIRVEISELEATASRQNALFNSLGTTLALVAGQLGVATGSSVDSMLERLLR